MIKVVYENVDKYNVTMDQDKEKILVEIDNLKQACDELKTVWKGYDADMFFNNMENYLNKMKNIPSSMEKITKFIRMSSSQYQEEDELYVKDLRVEQSRYKNR